MKGFFASGFAAQKLGGLRIAICEDVEKAGSYNARQELEKESTKGFTQQEKYHGNARELPIN